MHAHEYLAHEYIQLIRLSAYIKMANITALQPKHRWVDSLACMAKLSKLQISLATLAKSICLQKNANKTEKETV